MNKNILKFSSLAMLALAINFTSCKKAEEAVAGNNTPAAPETPQGAQAPTPDQFSSLSGDATGVLIAINSVTIQEVSGFSVDVKLGLGVAYFTDVAGNFSTFTNAGAVTLNQEVLTKQENNSYVYSPSTNNPTGISFSKGVDWLVKGNGGIPVVDYKGNRFPETPKLISEKTISKANAYSLDFSLKYQADTVICSIFSGSTTVSRGFKPKAGNNSIEFTADDLKDITVGETGGMIQIAAMNLVNKTSSGKGFVFINETVLTQIVEVK